MEHKKDKKHQQGREGLISYLPRLSWMQCQTLSNKLNRQSLYTSIRILSGCGKHAIIGIGTQAVALILLVPSQRQTVRPPVPQAHENHLICPDGHYTADQCPKINIIPMMMMSQHQRRGQIRRQQDGSNDSQHRPMTRMPGCVCCGERKDTQMCVEIDGEVKKPGECNL